MPLNLVQTKHPLIDRYIKVDKTNGRVLATKKTPGPFKNIPIARKRDKKA